jgi:septal ring factor EnvC (AmiA/AmiB activator)
MLTSIPESVRQALGELVARDLAAWLEGTLAERSINRTEWEQMTARVAAIEERLTAIEQRVAAIEQRVAAIEQRVAAIEHDVAAVQVEQREMRREMSDMRREMNERFDRVHEQMASQIRWSVGLLAVFGTLIAILVGIGQIAPLVMR